MAKITPSVAAPLFYVTSVDTTDTSGTDANGLNPLGKQFDTSAVGARSNVVLGYWPLEYNPPYSVPSFSNGDFYPVPWNNGSVSYWDNTTSPHQTGIGRVTRGFTGLTGPGGIVYTNNTTNNNRVKGTQLQWTTPSTLGYRWDDRSKIGTYNGTTLFGAAHSTYTAYTNQWVVNIQRLAGAVARQCADFYYFHGYLKGTGTHSGSYWNGSSYDLNVANSYMGCLTFRVGSHRNNIQTDITNLFVHPLDAATPTADTYNLGDVGSDASVGGDTRPIGELFPPWTRTGQSNAGADWPVSRARYTPWCTNGITETKIFYDALFTEMLAQFTTYLPYPEISGGLTTTYQLCYPAMILLDFEELNNNEFLYEIDTTHSNKQRGAIAAVIADAKSGTETIFKDSSNSNRTWNQEYTAYQASTPYAHSAADNADYTYKSNGLVTPFFGAYNNGNSPLYDFLYNVYSTAYDYAINEAIYKPARVAFPTVRCSNYGFYRSDPTNGRGTYGGWPWSNPRQSMCQGDIYSPVLYPTSPRQAKQGYSRLQSADSGSMFPRVTSATSNTLTVNNSIKVQTTHSAANATASASYAQTIQELASEWVYPTKTYKLDYFRGLYVNIISGTGSGQSRLCMNFDGSTTTFTVTPPWTVTPDNTSCYTVSTEPVEAGVIRNHTQQVEAIYKDKAVVPWMWSPGSFQEFGTIHSHEFMGDVIVKLTNKGISEYIIWGYNASFDNFTAPTLDNFIGDVTISITRHIANSSVGGGFVVGGL